MTLRFDVVTIFPEIFDSPLRASLLGRSLRSGLIQVGVHDLRNWAEGGHRAVDDAPYGGGAGMVMMPDPVVSAVEEIRQPDGSVMLLSAAGRRFDHRSARDLASESQVVLICGRYEGVDERAGRVLQAQEVSVGDFVLAGGELAALVVIEAVARLVPGLLGNPESLEQESFADGLLEYPQYTRPAVFRGLAVPEVLVSGDHGRIARWRREAALRRTLELRPDLLDVVDLSTEERLLIERWRMEASEASGSPPSPSRPDRES